MYLTLMKLSHLPKSESWKQSFGAEDKENTMTHIEFTVTGKGLFPVDMLRHDRCYPVGVEDSTAIEWSFNAERNRKTNPVRTVRLASERSAVADMHPCVGRWESFGWNVEVHYEQN